MPEYNGHRSKNAWNVALWIANDESLYRFAVHCLKTTRNTRQAAQKFLDESGLTRTPDGGEFNFTCVYEALKGLQS